MGKEVLGHVEGKGLISMDWWKPARYSLILLHIQPPRHFLTHVNLRFQFQIPTMAKIHPDHSASKELRSLLPYDTFIMTPLLEGKWIKISGSDCSVGPDWRDDDLEIVNLKRTLDAFQHFVMEHSGEHLIITDLQGISKSLYRCINNFT
jgi:hypothetical protein